MRENVVLVTGQLLTDAVWGGLPAALSASYDIHFADHGSDNSIAAMAARLLKQAPQRFHLVAHAMGGFIAFEVMRNAPERVRSLVLLSTLASADNAAQTERRMGYIRLVESGRFPEVVEERVPILLSPGRRNDPQLLELVRQMALETGELRFLAQQQAIMGRVDSRPSLASIRCPVLIVRGQEDGITSCEHQADLRNGITGAEFVSLADCGHLMMLEQPEQSQTLLLDWLTGQAAA